MSHSNAQEVEKKYEDGGKKGVAPQKKLYRQGSLDELRLLELAHGQKAKGTEEANDDAVTRNTEARRKPTKGRQENFGRPRALKVNDTAG